MAWGNRPVIECGVYPCYRPLPAALQSLYAEQAQSHVFRPRIRAVTREEVHIPTPPKFRQTSVSLTDRPTMKSELVGMDSEPSLGGGLSAHVTKYLKSQSVNAMRLKSVPTARSEPDDTLDSADACWRPHSKNNTWTPQTLNNRGHGHLAWPPVRDCGAPRAVWSSVDWTANLTPPLLGIPPRSREEDVKSRILLSTAYSLYTYSGAHFTVFRSLLSEED